MNITLVIKKSINIKTDARSTKRSNICERLWIFLKNMGENIGKIVSKKYSLKLLDHAKQSATDALQTASKKEI